MTYTTKDKLDIVELRKAATCIYIAVDKVVADDISRILTRAADEIERLQSEISELHDKLTLVRRQRDDMTAAFNKQGLR